MKKITLPLLVLTVCLAACRPSSGRQEIETIDVIGSLGKYRAIPLGEIATELEYIPLQTDSSYMIGLINQIVVTDTHIFIRDNVPANPVFAFDRDGKFLHPIGHVGRGPGEYTIASHISVDEKNRTIYLDALYNLLEYSWDGKFLRAIDTQEIAEAIGSTFSPNKMSFVRDNLFIGHFNNTSGVEKHRFVLFDGEARIVKTFDNDVQSKEKRAGSSTIFNSIDPYRVSGRLHVKELVVDTLYCLSEENELLPRFAFDLGKYTFQSKLYQIPSLNRPYSAGWIEMRKDMLGTPGHLFFNVSVMNIPGISLPKGNTFFVNVMGNLVESDDSRSLLGLYDLKEKKMEFLDRDPTTRLRGLINDIDGGLSFWPGYYTSADELVDVWNAYDMTGYLTDEYFSSHQIRNPEAHAKLKTLVQNLDAYDNPVVVIAKLEKR